MREVQRSPQKPCAISAPQGSSSESEDDGGEEVSAKSFLKKKPEGASEASKFLKTAKGSGVRALECFKICDQMD